MPQFLKPHSGTCLATLIRHICVGRCHASLILMVEGLKYDVLHIQLFAAGGKYQALLRLLSYIRRHASWYWVRYCHHRVTTEISLYIRAADLFIVYFACITFYRCIIHYFIRRKLLLIITYDYYWEVFLKSFSRCWSQLFLLIITFKNFHFSSRFLWYISFMLHHAAIDDYVILPLPHILRRLHAALHSYDWHASRYTMAAGQSDKVAAHWGRRFDFSYFRRLPSVSLGSALHTQSGRFRGLISTCRSRLPARLPAYAPLYFFMREMYRAGFTIL